MMESLILILGTGTLATWLLTRLLGPFSTALARRLAEGRRRTPIEFDPSAMRGEIEALHERVDFLERALARLGQDAPRRDPLSMPTEDRKEERGVITPV